MRYWIGLALGCVLGLAAALAYPALDREPVSSWALGVWWAVWSVPIRFASLTGLTTVGMVLVLITVALGG